MSSKNKNLSSDQDSDLGSVAEFQFAVIVSDWNEDITYALRDGCIDTLIKHGAQKDNIHVASVPGSFELPMGARLIMAKERVDAVICIGCVIKGETQHDQYINQAVANGVMNLGLTTSKPVIFGVLTPNSHQQAKDRAGGKYGNKGVESALTAIKMVQLSKGVNEGKGKIGFG